MGGQTFVIIWPKRYLHTCFNDWQELVLYTKLANNFKLEVCYVCEWERGGSGIYLNSICFIIIIKVIMITIVMILMMILERAWLLLVPRIAQVFPKLPGGTRGFPGVTKVKMLVNMTMLTNIILHYLTAFEYHLINKDCSSPPESDTMRRSVPLTSSLKNSRRHPRWWLA